MKDIKILHNSIQNYSWGSKSIISQLLNKESPSVKPEAELWMGAHPRAPSCLEKDGKKISLCEYISLNPSKILGEYTHRQFNGKLPFLLKVPFLE